MIPKIIHLMWLDKNNPHNPGFPSKYTNYMDQWKNMNPSWQIMYWNYSDIEREFPDFMPIIEKIPVWISKCDFARVLVLYKYGGVYIDLDFFPLRPFDDHVTDRDLLLIYEPQEHSKYWNFDGLILNSIMGASPNHEFFKGFIDVSIHKILTTDPHRWNVIASIGPNGLYSYYSQYWKHSFAIDPLDTCLFIPSLQSFIPNKTTGEMCNVIKPYCTTKWDEGTEWFNGTTPQFHIVRRRSSEPFTLRNVLKVILKIILFILFIMLVTMLIIYMGPEYGGSK